MERRIAIFDIDGTLTDTNLVDEECYLAAVRQELGCDVGPDWGGIQDVTDAQILRALWARERAVPFPEVVERSVVSRFVRLLEREVVDRPQRFRAVPGARQVFGLARRLGWSPAIATGAWRESALLKLRTAAIPFDGVPLSTSSEHVARADIIARLLMSAPGPAPKAVVYFGDALWDVRAAEVLGIRFVGVGRGPAAELLRAAGADLVIGDFRDSDALAEALSA
jgi:phosphoglycolate phosphatase-like HAD superfamily hydrolase